MRAIAVRHLFISPGHNFFGHHGEEAGKSPLHEVEEIECVAGRGVRGDASSTTRKTTKVRSHFSPVKCLKTSARRWVQAFHRLALRGAMSLPKG